MQCSSAVLLRPARAVLHPGPAQRLDRCSAVHSSWQCCARLLTFMARKPAASGAPSTCATVMPARQQGKRGVQGCQLKQQRFATNSRTARSMPTVCSKPARHACCPQPACFSFLHQTGQACALRTTLVLLTRHDEGHWYREAGGQVKLAAACRTVVGRGVGQLGGRQDKLVHAGTYRRHGQQLPVAPAASSAGYRGRECCIQSSPGIQPHAGQGSSLQQSRG